MLQRKQSLFLLLSLICALVCLCLPIGTIAPITSMGTDLIVNNLGLKGASFSSYMGWPLYAVLVLNCALCVITIFLYKNRTLQMKFCSIQIVLYGIWYVYYIYSVLETFPVLGIFKMNWSVSLPLVSIILCAMAHKGIKNDEELVRSADRIR